MGLFTHLTACVRINARRVKKSACLLLCRLPCCCECLLTAERLECQRVIARLCFLCWWLWEQPVVVSRAPPALSVRWGARRLAIRLHQTSPMTTLHLCVCVGCSGGGGPRIQTGVRQILVSLCKWERRAHFSYVREAQEIFVLSATSMPPLRGKFN